MEGIKATELSDLSKSTEMLLTIEKEKLYSKICFNDCGKEFFFYPALSHLSFFIFGRKSDF